MQKAGFVDNHTKTGGERLEFTNKAEGVHTIDPDCSTVSASYFCSAISSFNAHVEIRRAETSSSP